MGRKKVVAIFIIVAILAIIFSSQIIEAVKAIAATQNTIAVIAVLFPILVLAFFCVAYFFLAKPSQNRWFTFVKEGTAKIIVRGEAYDKTIIQWKGHKLDENGDVIECDDEDKSFFGGFKYYGLYPIKDIYVYNFQWTGVAENGEIVHHPKETLDSIVLKDDVYWAEIKAAEDKDLLPLTLELVITACVVNPYKAIFNIQNWLETVINRIKPWARDAVTHDIYSNLIQDKDRIGEQIYKTLDKSGLIKGEFLERYGVKVRKIEVKEINPPDEYRETTLQKYIAEREREAIIVKADAEAKRLEIVYGQIERFHDLGKLLRTLEAIEKSPLAASLSIQAVPGLPEVLKGVYNKSTADTSQSELKDEIRDLKETVKKVLETQNK
jgi:hypothetical protein